MGIPTRRLLQYMHNLSDILLNQGKWKETFDISLEEVEIRKTLLSTTNKSKVLAIENATISAAKMKAWDNAAPLLEQELSWRQEMMESEEQRVELRHGQMWTLGLAATAYLDLGRIQEAKFHIASFLYFITEGGTIRTSILNIIENIAAQCDTKGAMEEAEQLTILEILLIESGVSDNKSTLNDLVKRVLDLKDRQGTTGSEMAFDPTGLIERARVGATNTSSDPTSVAEA